MRLDEAQKHKFTRLIALSPYRLSWAGNGSSGLSLGIMQWDFGQRLSASSTNTLVPLLGLHVASVLPTHLKQRIRDLTQRADAHRVHQHFEHIQVLDHGLLKFLQHRG